MKTLNKEKGVPQYTEEEVKAFLEDHRVQQLQQNFRRQLAELSYRARYQTIVTAPNSAWHSGDGYMACRPRFQHGKS